MPRSDFMFCLILQVKIHAKIAFLIARKFVKTRMSLIGDETSRDSGIVEDLRDDGGATFRNSRFVMRFV